MRRILVLISVISLITFSINIAYAEEDNSERKKYTKALSLMIGQGYWGGNGNKYITQYTIGLDLWIVPSRAVGFYGDVQLWPDEDNSLIYMSYGVSVRPLGYGNLDPYLQLGFLVGRTKNKEDVFAMPVTIGMNAWIGSGFGAKVQVRFYPFSGQELYSVSTGLFFKI